MLQGLSTHSFIASLNQVASKEIKTCCARLTLAERGEYFMLSVGFGDQSLTASRCSKHIIRDNSCLVYNPNRINRHKRNRGRIRSNLPKAKQQIQRKR